VHLLLLVDVIPIVCDLFVAVPVLVTGTLVAIEDLLPTDDLLETGGFVEELPIAGPARATAGTTGTLVETGDIVSGGGVPGDVVAGGIVTGGIVVGGVIAGGIVSGDIVAGGGISGDVVA